MNGTDQIMKWLVGLAAAAAVSLSGWNLTTTSDNQSRLSVVEERSNGVASRLNRIEDKIDWLIQEQVKAYEGPRPTRRTPRPPYEAGP